MKELNSKINLLVNTMANEKAAAVLRQMAEKLLGEAEILEAGVRPIKPKKQNGAKTKSAVRRSPYAVKLKKWREETGITQPEVAELIGHDLNFQHISHFECGRVVREDIRQHIIKFIKTDVEAAA